MFNRGSDGFGVGMQLEDRDAAIQRSEPTLIKLLDCLVTLAEEIKQIKQEGKASEESRTDEVPTVIIEIKDHSDTDYYSSHDAEEGLPLEDPLPTVEKMIESITKILERQGQRHHCTNRIFIYPSDNESDGFSADDFYHEIW